MKIKNWDKWLLEGFNTDEYYTETDRREFIEMGRNKIPFDKVIPVTGRKRVFAKDERGVWYWTNYERSMKPEDILAYFYNLSIPGYEYYEIEIYRLEDEWYMVRTEYKGVNTDLSSGTLYREEIKYYKCDQWEGLMKLLEDKKLVK